MLNADLKELSWLMIGAGKHREEEAFRRYGREAVGKLTMPKCRELLLDPVATADGQSYERTAIERWLTDHDTSRATGAQLSHKTLICLRTLVDTNGNGSKLKNARELEEAVQPGGEVHNSLPAKG